MLQCYIADFQLIELFLIVTFNKYKARRGCVIPDNYVVLPHP